MHVTFFTAIWIQTSTLDDTANSSMFDRVLW
jgi:hypothetical protein